MARFHETSREYPFIEGRGPAPQIAFADLIRPYVYRSANGTDLAEAEAEAQRPQPQSPRPPWPGLCMHDAPPTMMDAPLSAPPEWHRELAGEHDA